LSTLDNYRVEVSDIRGKAINASISRIKESVELDLRGVGKGLYIVRIYHDKGVEKHKLIIK
jgi:putative component of toxin-antitoxin plasmid stabilization module